MQSPQMSLRLVSPQAAIRQVGQVYMIRLLWLPVFWDSTRWAWVMLGAIEAESGKVAADSLWCRRCAWCPRRCRCARRRQGRIAVKSGDLQATGEQAYGGSLELAAGNHIVRHLLANPMITWYSGAGRHQVGLFGVVARSVSCRVQLGGSYRLLNCLSLLVVTTSAMQRRFA